MTLTDTLSDFFARIKGALPSSWFKDDTPIVDGVVQGSSQSMYAVYQMLQEAFPQLRITTATNGFLDMIAGDFFGLDLLRLPGESDNDYRTRILVALFRESGTKGAMSKAIALFTGVYPKIVEYGQAVNPVGYFLSEGRDTLNGYGEVVKPHQCFIDVYMPVAPTVTLAYVGGYGSSVMGYSTPSRCEYVSSAAEINSSLIELVNSIRPASTKVWLKFIFADINTLINTYNVTVLDTSNTLTDQYGGILVDGQTDVLTDSTYTN